LTYYARWRNFLLVHSRGVATREALVETAERLFAEQGIETVSLRDVSKAAGQRNHNAAQYHFGDRAGLVAAVYDHRMRLVNERRHAMLATAAAEGRTDDVPTLVAAVLVPLTDVVAETAGWYGRFLARTQWDTFASGVVGELPVLSSYRHAVELLVAALPDLPRPVIANRIDQMGALLIGTVPGWEWRLHRDEPALPLDDLQTDLTTTITAVLTAPVTTRSEIR
jgi:AcrR family transcriptional regulator